MSSRIFIVIIGLVLFPQLASAKVRGISGSQEFVDANGVTGEKAVVRCLTGSQSRTIVRMDGEREWCDSEVTSICRANKLNTAKKVCSSSYRRALDEQLAGKPAKAAEPAKVTTKAEPAKPAKVETVSTPVKVDNNSAQSELFEIEQKRVQIKQRQLELRKRELELEKQRAADIESGF